MGPFPPSCRFGAISPPPKPRFSRNDNKSRRHAFETGIVGQKHVRDDTRGSAAAFTTFRSVKSPSGRLNRADRGTGQDQLTKFTSVSKFHTISWMLCAYRRILLSAVVLTLTGLHISRLNAQIGKPEPGKLSEWVTALAIDPQDTRRLYAGSRYGTYLSTDGGVSWNVLSGSPDWPNALEVNPSNPQTIFATTYGLKDDGVFRGEDGGNRWSKVLGVEGLWTVAIDPLNPDTIYAGSCSCDIGMVPGLFQTTDGGTTWVQILGTPIYAAPGALSAESDDRLCR